MELSAQHCRLLLDVARGAIRATLADSPLPALEGPDYEDDKLRQPAGCFVTLHELFTHRLRGCIGRIEATDPLLHTVQRTAVNVLSDPRFGRRRVRSQPVPSRDAPIAPALASDRNSLRLSVRGLLTTPGGYYAPTGCINRGRRLTREPRRGTPGRNLG